MRKYLLCLFSAFCLINTLYSPLYASKSRPFRSEDEADAYLTEHYNKGCAYYTNESWRHAATEFEKVIYFFPCTDEAATASYYLAVSYFEMKEYDFANEEFSNYLKASQHPEFFEDAVYFKFCIAEYFKAGKKRRPFKMRYLPKWISGQDSALEIYDEVVAALPNHELTIRALQSKAELLRRMGEYRECVETYQLIIRRFPKNEIIPACYLNIAETYYEQSKYEFQNPDILALAELNVRKFKDDFPRDERVEMAEETVCRIKELYAKGLCDLGLFYQRMEKPEAAAIYFQSSIEEFPDTKVARFCRTRLKCLGYGPEEEIVPPCEEIAPPCEEIAPCIDEIPSDCLDGNNLNPEPTFVPEESFPSFADACMVPEEPVQWTSEQPQIQEEMPCTCDRCMQPDSSGMQQNYPWEESCSPLNEAQEYAPAYEYPSSDESSQQEAETPYYLHYSEMKRRKQYVAPQR